MSCPARASSDDEVRGVLARTPVIGRRRTHRRSLFKPPLPLVPANRSLSRTNRDALDQNSALTGPFQYCAKPRHRPLGGLCLVEHLEHSRRLPQHCQRSPRLRVRRDDDAAARLERLCVTLERAYRVAQIIKRLVKHDDIETAGGLIRRRRPERSSCDRRCRDGASRSPLPRCQL
jgi:hypothetical protein